MADMIQLRRDTAANWTSANPILAQGEPGLETDPGKLKVGDGSTAWSSLSYYTLGTAGYLAATNPVISAGTLTEDTYALSGTSVALDPDNGSVQTHILAGNTIYSDGFSDGQAVTLMVNDGAGRTVNWPTMTWVNNGGSAPTLATTGYTVVALWKVGVTLYGALVGDGS